MYKVLVLAIKVFVPLSGLVSVNSVDFYLDRNVDAVFVPLSGLVSVNNLVEEDLVHSLVSFRPLIGVSFCKPIAEIILKNLSEFSSPYRG